MSYPTWLVERARALFRRGYLPYERKVCVYGHDLRLLCVLAAAGGMAWWWQTHWSLLVSLMPPWLLWPWAAYTTLKAGWFGSFLWADLGIGEWWMKAWLHRPSCQRPPSYTEAGVAVRTGLTLGCCGGTRYLPTTVNTTLEGYAGCLEAYPEMIQAWRENQYRVLAPWWGDPGSGRLGDDDE